MELPPRPLGATLGGTPRRLVPARKSDCRPIWEISTAIPSNQGSPERTARSDCHRHLDPVHFSPCAASAFRKAQSPRNQIDSRKSDCNPIWEISTAIPSNQGSPQRTARSGCHRHLDPVHFSLCAASAFRKARSPRNQVTRGI